MSAAAGYVCLFHAPPPLVSEISHFITLQIAPFSCSIRRVVSLKKKEKVKWFFIFLFFVGNNVREKSRMGVLKKTAVTSARMKMDKPF